MLPMGSRYDFLVDTYETEILKVLSVWSMADEQQLDLRPRDGDRRGRTLREHMVQHAPESHASNLAPLAHSAGLVHASYQRTQELGRFAKK